MPDSTSLARYFFRQSHVVETPGEVVVWWESRRLSYNLVVGASGLITLVSVNALAAFPPGARLLGVPFLPIAAYAVLANVFYSGGWIAELGLRRVFGSRTPIVGAALFRYGFAFSVGLTLLPITIGVIDFGVRLLGRFVF